MKIYNIVINSLTGFYERNGGEGTVEVSEEREGGLRLQG